MSRAPAPAGERIRRLSAVLGLACVTTLVVPTSALGLPRTTADPADVRITVTALSPTSLTPADTLLVTARVFNSSDQTLLDVGARLRVGAEPFGSRDEFAAFSAGEGAPEVGTVATASLVDVAAELPPGAVADVRIEVPASELGLVAGFGVHPLTLELRVAEPGDTRRTAGAVRTSLVTVGEAAPPTVRLGVLWPLIGTPGRDPDGLLPAPAATELAADVRPEGRLGALLAAGTARSVTWIIDGALLEDVRTLSTGNGLPADVQPDSGAAAWLAGLTEESGRVGADVTALPYADPDLVAVRRAGLQHDLPLARTLGVDTVSRTLATAVRDAPAWPGNGVANKATLETLRDQEVATVLLSSSTLEPRPELAATPDALADLAAIPELGLVTSDAALDDVVSAGPAQLGGIVLASQRLLAETAMVAAERPNDARSLVVAPPRRWSPTPEWAQAVAGVSASWLERVTLAELAERPGDAPAATTRRYTDADRAAEVSRTQLDDVADARGRLTRFSEVVADPEVFLASYEPALLSAQSTAWRGKGRPAGRAFTAALTRDVRAAVTSVQLKPRGQVTLSSRTGIIPLAVQNTLDQAVRVRVRVTSTPSVRLRSEPTEVITIGAGRTASVDVVAEATADATFPVVAVLLTEDGDPLGKPVTFTVRATGYGQVARIVVGGALVLLAGAVVVRVARRIRTARAAEGGTLDP